MKVNHSYTADVLQVLEGQKQGTPNGVKNAHHIAI